MEKSPLRDPVDMPRGGLLRIDDGAGATLHVREGELWLTEEGGREDHLLQAGRRYRIGRGGTTLAQAFRDSAVSISPAMPGNPAQRVGLALRRFCAYLLAPLFRPENKTF